MKTEIPTSEAVEVAKQRRLENFFSILGMILESNDDCEMLIELNGYGWIRLENFQLPLVLAIQPLLVFLQCEFTLEILDALDF